MSVTARTTQLVRVPDLRAFRRALLERACGGTPGDVQDRLLLVPTRAAAAYVTGSIERNLRGSGDAVDLPEFATRAQLHSTLAQRLSLAPQPLTEAEREVLMGAACRQVRQEGTEPPFRLRPGLVAAIVEFYDTLRRNLKQVDTFARLALGMLEPGAADDRGAERLVRQSRFLIAVFGRFERLCQETGRVDEHLLRQQLLMNKASQPWRHIIVTVGDQAVDPQGLFAADWDLLARIHGLQQLDVVVTDAVLAGAFHERIHQLLPGIAEVRPEPDQSWAPALVVPPGGSLVYAARDREEEIAGFARRVRRESRTPDRMALVVRRPLPYVYLAREVLKSAGIASRMVDALPLAAEPFAAALDVVFASVTSNFARGPAVALLRSPHFRFGEDIEEPTEHAVAELDRALSEAGYLGGIEVLERFVAEWDMRVSRSAPSAAVRQLAHHLLDAAKELALLRTQVPCAEHLDRLLGFLAAHERPPVTDDLLTPRLVRGRTAVLDVLTGLRDAYARFDPTPTSVETLVPVVRRGVEERTFTVLTEGESTGDLRGYPDNGGVHVVDADSARFGDFDVVQLAGLVEGEWPEAPRRNIFYPPVLLRELGWPSEAQRLDYTRAAFGDLLRLPSTHIAVSTFTLEDDVLVAPSPLVDALAVAGLQTIEQPVPTERIFEYEALALGPVDLERLSDVTRPAALRRIAAAGAGEEGRAVIGGSRMTAYSVSALERYQDCPFKFFAADVLRLEEPPQDEPTLSPRARGRFVHEVFQRFFEAWDARGDGTITVERLDEARALFEEIAAPMLSRLAESEAALEYARLLGSAASIGVVDVVLAIEASRPIEVSERWLEHRLEGEFSLGASGGRRVALKGVADRVDFLAGNRLRVIDYKSGYPPNPKRALQAAVYALCAQERLAECGRGTWTVDEATYVAFSGKRPVVPVVRAGAFDADAVLSSARGRVVEAVEGIERGIFPPRPDDPHICSYCAYPLVCRKDYVGDE
jgi:RecB family exonuclease